MNVSSVNLILTLAYFCPCKILNSLNNGFHLQKKEGSCKGDNKLIDHRVKQLLHLPSMPSDVAIVSLQADVGAIYTGAILYCIATISCHLQYLLAVYGINFLLDGQKF